MVKKGIQNTSVSDITDACGFSKGIFYYFTSKNDFLMAAIRGLNVDDASNKARSKKRPANRPKDHAVYETVRRDHAGRYRHRFLQDID